MYNTLDQDTICAISTAPGVGGIAVIRISGPDAITLCDQCFSPNGKAKKISEMKAYTMGFGRIIEQDKTLDEVVAGVFRAPHSYTGEDIVEITCHGSSYIQQRILEILLQKGCRMAHPGEYTQRAFMNGKMDLSQAEAVADVIASSSAGQHKLAISQMRGGFSKKLTELRKQLLHFTSLIELELDFGEEDVSFANRDELLTLAENIQTYITKLADSFKIGNAVKNGIPVAIVGETNAGKSTLLNYFVGEERAIVSDIHGTTRDVIEDTINIGGIIYRFIDTAGIRQTTDTIENMGIERTYAKINQARIVLWLIDLTAPIAQTKAMIPNLVQKTKDKTLILVLNKADKVNTSQLDAYQELLRPIEAQRIIISAKKHQHTEELKTLLQETARLPELATQDVIVTNARHYEALLHAKTALTNVIEGLHNQLSGDFLSQDIHDCLRSLATITGGEITSQEVLNNIFKGFCIGK